MSAEVYGKNEANTRLVSAVALGVVDILKSTGVSPAEAHTSGEQAARYAAELLLSSLEFCGEVGPGSLADDHFTDLVTKIAKITIDPSLTEELLPE